MLYTAHTIENTAATFGRTPEDVQDLVDRCLTRLKEHRDKHRPRPDLDDKILAGWNGLMVRIY